MATCTDCAGVCSLWVDPDEINCPGTIEEYGTELEVAAQVASDWLYMATGRRFPGCCQTTVRPCPRVRVVDHDPTGWYRELPQQGGWYQPTGWNGSWGSGSCGGSCGGGCGGGAHEVELGLEPVRDIVAVIIDGVTLDTSEYYVVDYSKLVRSSGAAWPCSNDLSITSGEGAWSVEFTYGRSAPSMGAAAAKVLACEITKALVDQGDDCALPENVRALVRQGVTLDFDNVTTEAGAPGWFTGLWLPDKFINTYNPGGLAREADVFSPDLRRAARVVTS